MKNQDLTSGSIGKQLTLLALPLLAGNILQQLYNTVDAAVIGRYAGQDAFGAVGVAGTVMNLFIFILSGSCSGITVLFAQLYGQRDMESFRKESYLTMVWGSACTVVFSLLSFISIRPLLRLIHTPEQVLAHAESYLRLIIAGLIVTFLYNLLASVLRAVGDTWAALVFLAAAILINTALDFLFVAYAGLGTAGAALATLLSQLVSALLCLFYIKKRYPELLFRREDRKIDSALARKTVSFSASTALHQSSLYIGKLLVQGSVNALGAEAICAYTAAVRIEGFANSFGDGGSQSLSVFLAQNYGAGKKDRIRRGVLCGFFLMSSMALALGFLMHQGAVPLIALLNGNSPSIDMKSGVSYLRIIAFFYPFCFIGNVFVGYFRGTGRVRIPVLGTTLHISLRVLIACILTPSMGLPAVAAACGAGWIAVVIFFILCTVFLAGILSPKPCHDHTFRRFRRYQ